MATKSFVPRDHYAEVTNKIIEALESGVVPWRRPWDPAKAQTFGPLNAVTGRHYRGINVLMLGMSPLAFETGDPRWCSYQQAQDKKWQVRKGERASTVFFFRMIEADGRPSPSTPDDNESRQIPVLRSYPVFHASQIDGIDPYLAAELTDVPWRVPEAVDTIILNSRVAIREGGDRAFYSPSTDHIQMPTKVAFESNDKYSSVLLHELAHWTGHPSRLNRDFSGKFGSHAYALEELSADLGSVMVSTEIGLNPDIGNHASYAESWLRALREDASKKIIFRCSAAAQRIADTCLSFHPDYAVRVAAESRDGGNYSAATTVGDAQPKSRPTAAVEMPGSQKATSGAQRSRSNGPIQIAAALPAHMRRSMGLEPTTIPCTPQPTQEEPAWTPPTPR